MSWRALATVFDVIDWLDERAPHLAAELRSITQAQAAAHVCPACSEISHDWDCPLTEDGRPVDPEATADNPTHGLWDRRPEPSP